MELALLLPVLLVLVLGIVEFGRAFQVQATLAAAAREGARAFALDRDADVNAAVIEASASLDTTLIDTYPEVEADNCIVKVDYPMSFLTDFFGATIDLSATGVMRCNG
ncbi:TadE/TadG family type IV pilus assembly protein [Blastococcus sp. HT6-30]|uniref:TadE/TadG family type IV pilus assembly protein n=1 Tax=Blastococcus sp. HT6-30 TaxID=3144843 RepID=UPI003219FFAF